MPRPISNPRLAELLKESRMCLHDLAAITGVSRFRLLDYARGRPLPRLERKLARAMDCTVPELRGLLGLEDGREHGAQVLERAAAFLRQYNAAQAIFHWDRGSGRWVNGGERFAGWPGIQGLIPMAQSVPTARIMRNRRGEFWVDRCFYVRRRPAAAGRAVR
jgi:hypothetical protein